MPKDLQALANLKKKVGYAAAKDVIRVDYDKLLEPIKTACLSNAIYFDPILAAHRISSSTFQKHLTNIFTTNFPKTKTDNHILLIAEGALIAFLAGQKRHTYAVRKIDFYVHERFNTELGRSKPKELEKKLAKELDSAGINNSGVAAKYMDLYKRKVKEAKALALMKKMKQKKDELTKEEQIKQEQEIVDNLPDIKDGLDKIVDKNSDNKKAKSAIDLFPDIEKAATDLDLNREGELFKELKKQLEEYHAKKNALKLAEQAREKLLATQREWLKQYRLDLISSMSTALTNVLLGNAGDEGSIDYATTTGQVVEGEMGVLLAKSKVWAVYEPLVGKAVEAKLKALTSLSPRTFKEDAEKDAIKNNLTSGTDLLKDYKANLGSETLNTAAVRDLLKLRYAGGNTLDDSLINEEIEDLAWTDITIAGTAKLNAAMNDLISQYTASVGNVKFPINVCEGAVSTPAYKKYSQFLEDYTNPLREWGLSDKGKMSLDVAWLGHWEELFKADAKYKDNILEKYKKLNDKKKETELEAYTDNLLTLIENDYGVDYVTDQTVAASLCKEWFMISKTGLSSFKKAEYVQKVFEAVSEMSSLITTFGGLGNAIKEVKQNSGAWDSWNDIFKQTDSAWSGFKNATEAMGLAATAVGTAVDIGVAYQQTKAYKKSKGDRAYGESWKKVRVLGTIPITIGELRDTKKDIKDFKSMKDKYFLVVKDKVTFDKKKGEYNINDGEDLDDTENKALERVKRFHYAAGKLYKKYINKLMDFIGKVTSYVILVLTLIPTGVTQLIAGFLGILNGLQSLGRSLYGWANYWYKKRKGTQGEGRRNVATALTDDAFEVGSVDVTLDRLLKNDAMDVMWKAGIYKSDEIAEKLTKFSKGESTDPNYPIWNDPLVRALETVNDLRLRIGEIIANRDKDTTRYMTTRIMMKDYMEDYLRST